eukprot:sb/3465313/
MLQHSRRGLGLLWNTRFLTIETKKKPITVSQYSSLQKKINEFASKPKNQPTLHSIMMESNNKSKNRLIQSCQYMRHEFLVRVAHVITHLQNLPYIILTNEDIKRVLDLYMYAFTDMLHQPVIRSMKDVDKFNENLSGLLEDLTDIILLLSKGIHDSQLHVNDPEFPATIGKTMDYIVINRLCNRILARHHLSMHIQRNLPYIILTNEDIKRVLDLYMYAFTDMLHQPVIRSMKDVDKFNENLSGLLEDLTDIILLLSKGIHDSQLHVNDPEFPATIGKTMDYIVINRLCNRILARHHLSMHIQREGYISVVNTDLSLKRVIQRNATFSANVCQNVYMESLPEVIIDGHADARVAFIPNIIDYVIREVLKNAFRATVENNLHQVEKPPIICTISNSADYWKIR